MALINIKNFLINFKFPSPPEDYLKREIKNYLKNNFSFMEDECEVKIKKSGIFICISNSVIKNEIFLNQTKILNYLKDKFPSRLLNKINFSS